MRRPPRSRSASAAPRRPRERARGRRVRPAGDARSPVRRPATRRPEGSHEAKVATPVMESPVNGMSGTGKSTALGGAEGRGSGLGHGRPGWSEWVLRGEPWERCGEDRVANLLSSDDGHALRLRQRLQPGQVLRPLRRRRPPQRPRRGAPGRIESRTTNDYGKSPGERERILSDLAAVEPLLRATCTHELDASRPVGDVVAALVAIAAAEPR